MRLSSWPHVLKREKFSPLHLRSGDSVVLTWTDENGSREVCHVMVEAAMVLDEAVIFLVQPGTFGEHVKGGIGGAFLETQ